MSVNVILEPKHGPYYMALSLPVGAYVSVCVQRRGCLFLCMSNSFLHLFTQHSLRLCVGDHDEWVPFLAPTEL